MTSKLLTITTDIASTVADEITSGIDSISDVVTSDVTEVVENATNLWFNIGGGEKMQFTDALMVSVVGFLIVFAVLGFLAVFVSGMGKVFDSIQKKAKTEEHKLSVSVTGEAPKAPEGTPLPSNQSAGELTLINVTEEEAVVIMAVTSEKTGIPLNRLKFNSITYLEEK